MADRVTTEGNPAPIVDRATRPKTVLRLVVLAIALIASAAAFVAYKDRLDNDLVLALLGVLAMMGIFFLVSSVIGFIQVMPGSQSDPIARAFIDGHPEGMLITDRKGRVIYANRAYGDLTGAEGARDVQPIEAILSRFKESTEAVYRLSNAMRDGREDHEEFRLMRPLSASGSRSGAHWYRLRARKLAVDGRRGESLQAWQLSDISAEREDQERFFKELQHAIDYLDHAPAGFLSAGRRGEIFYINATLADWLDIDLTQFEPGSMTLGDLVAGEGMALVESVRAEPGLNRTASLDLDMLKTNGQSLAVTLLHRVSTAHDGAPGESRTIVLARTAGAGGIESSHAGAAAEMRFTRFFNNTPMAIASVDANGRVLRTNAPFLKMFSGIVSRDGMQQGALFEQVFHEVDRSAFAIALDAAVDGQGEIAPVDSRHPNDEDRHFRFYVNAVIDRSGESAEEAAIIYAVETTEQKMLETQMAQTQKMNAVGTLAGGIAHDFNNVLTAILLSADHLLLSLRASDSGFADLMEIKRNSNRAAVLVRQLLAFSRKQTLRPSVLQMTDVIADLRMLLDRLTGTEVKLAIDYGRDLWPVRTDLGQFEQVIINLCLNARDAMPDGGTITIRSRNVPEADAANLNRREMPDGDYVVIEIADEGTGIPADVMEKIFEPFFTTKDVGKGTGLGLSMVYGIIKQSGGYIYADSTVGAGTTFAVFLPRHVEEAVPEAEPDGEEGTVAAPGDPKPASTDGSERAGVKTAHDALPAARNEPADLTGGSAVVLLVEDEEAVRRGGKRILESRGYTVHEAESGVEALEIMRELDGAVDIVVSDVVMPEMDGPSLLRELRKDYPDLRFIFVSGYAEDAFAKNLPADAEFGFLPKPFSLKQLAVAVREMLDRDED